MTWNDFARCFWPGIDDDAAGALLWNCTAFPAASPKHIAYQLRRMRRMAKTVTKALAIADRELTEELQALNTGTKHRRKQKGGQ